MLNVVRAWEECTLEEKRRGCEWYCRAHYQAIDVAFGLEGVNHAVVGAGVVAALSPGLAWDQNLVSARELVRRCLIHPGHHLVGIAGYGPNKAKAKRIALGENPLRVLGGKKVCAFYKLLRDGGNPTDVCVDGHALNMALGRGKLRIDSSYATPAEGDLVREGFRAAGHYLGIWPCKVQAATWLAWRASQGFAQGRLPF